MNITPVVSICLTTFNRADIIQFTIDSILKQTFIDFELIITDDCSTDNTADICNAYMQKDSRIKYYCNEKNLKMPGNLNAAIRKASGKYIANLHDGDIYRPDLIEKWYDNLHKNPSANFVFNQYRMLDAKGNIVCIYDHGFKDIEHGFSLRKYLYDTLSSAPWGTVMVRKSAYEKEGLFDPEFGFISDVEMWMRLSKSGDFGYINEPLIDLTPRERTHKYFLPDATVFYLNLLIVYRYVQSEEQQIKELIDKKAIVKNIRKQLKFSVLQLIKYKNLKRIREFNFLMASSGYQYQLFFLIPLLLLGVSKPAKIDTLMWKSICKMQSVK
jgi:glycosyltransferase involved in cell wall biosynthesis